MSEATSPAVPRPDNVLRAQLLQRGRRVAAPLPDGLLALVLGLAALVDFLPQQMLELVPTWILASRHEFMTVLFVEGAFLMMQGSLVDIATRLRKRPPIWLGVLIIAGVALFSGDSMRMIIIAWQQGMAVFLPLLLSLAERGAMLWRMPDRSVVEKLAARALIANRITTGLALGGAMTLLLIMGPITGRYEFANLGQWPLLGAGAIYFAIAAYDDWRVRGRRFAEKPAVLFRYDPIGMTYLERL
jgi:hypothetical protein